jgi:osmotically-inducible protein OsmY
MALSIVPFLRRRDVAGGTKCSADEELRRKVLAELRRNPVLRPFRDTIQVAVRQGIVEVTGHVNLQYQARLAEAEAREIPGVVDVQNRLITDEWLEYQIAGALLNDPLTHDAVIRVNSWLGRVTLEGKVPSEEARRRAAEVAQSIAGVVSVSNETQVDPAPLEPWRTCLDHLCPQWQRAAPEAQAA